MPLDEPGPDADARRAREAEVISLLHAAARLLSEDDATAVSASGAQRLTDLFAEVERSTPLGVSVHARLDAVRKWLVVLGEPADHARFGGAVRLRDHVLAQLRGAEAAVRDYFDAQP